MTLINPFLSEMIFRETIANLALTTTEPPVEAVLQAFSKLEQDYVSTSGLYLLGRILVNASGTCLASIEYPNSPIHAATFATDRLCILYAEALIAAQTASKGELEQIGFKFDGTHIVISPLAIPGLCLIDLFSIKR